MASGSYDGGIVAALAAVMDEVQAVAKTDRNDHQKFNFRGVDAVVNAVGPALREYDVVVLPHVDHVTYEPVQTSTGKPSTACRVVVTYTFYASDGSSLSCTVAGEAWDSGDKACPKAMSVAWRTALIQALSLPTDEPDPDSHTYERGEPSKDVQRARMGVEAARLVAGLSDEHRQTFTEQWGDRPLENLTDDWRAWLEGHQAGAA